MTGQTEAGASDAEQALEQDLAFLVRALECLYQRRRYPLERAHYLLLLSLSDGPRTTGELALALGLDHSTVTRQIAAMEAHGHVCKRPNPADGRSALIAATERGTAECAAMRSVRLERLGRLLTGWSDDEKAVFAGGVRRFRDALVAWEDFPAASGSTPPARCG